MSCRCTRNPIVLDVAKCEHLGFCSFVLRLYCFTAPHVDFCLRVFCLVAFKFVLICFMAERRGGTRQLHYPPLLVRITSCLFMRDVNTRPSLLPDEPFVGSDRLFSKSAFAMTTLQPGQLTVVECRRPVDDGIVSSVQPSSWRRFG